ncbi:MAG: YtxH domain-containing protein [Actinobacteria bacterium]|nr:YtxH domain-containing protein [Actinomycetota bacterium]
MPESSQEVGKKVLDKQRLRTFLLGGAAGILAGILLAPRSGKELRGSVMERAGEARERGRETLFEARERMQERLSETREVPQRRSPDPSDPRPEEATTPRRSHLRDVSSGVEEEPVERDAERSEELRRKVRETRARLKGRLDGPRPIGEDRDPGPDQ